MSTTNPTVKVAALNAEISSMKRIVTSVLSASLVEVRIEPDGGKVVLSPDELGQVIWHLQDVVDGMRKRTIKLARVKVPSYDNGRAQGVLNAFLGKSGP